MKDFLKLVRWPNLVVIIVTMTFMLFLLINPLLGLAPFEAGLSPVQFGLLVISVVLITMGGYIINDVVDINPDSINKPGKNLIGQSISEKSAQTLYWVISLAGLLCGTLFSYLLNQINYSLIFVFSAGLLWFYSQKYKGQPLVGNLVVALLSGLSFGLVWLFTFFAMSYQAQEFAQVQPFFALVTKLVFIYVGFAFAITLLRELIKDLEDFAGDNRFGCRTLPVAYGTGPAKKVALVVGYLSLAGLLWTDYFFIRLNYVGLTGWFILLAFFLGFIQFKLHGAKEISDFSKLSRLTKLLMLLGILSLVFFYFEQP